MALANYTDLKASVATWLARSDLTSDIPDFILLAESDMNQRLSTLETMTKNAAFSITGEYVAVPADFNGLRNMYRNGPPREPIEYLTNDQQLNAFTTTGKPRYVEVVGGNFHFAPVPDATYSATMVYYSTIPPMASNATNWLLTAHPELYLYATLAAAASRIMNDERVPLWKQLYESALANVIKADRQSRWGVNGMTQRPG